MKWAHPWWLVAVPLTILAGGVFLAWVARRRREMLDRVVAPRLHERLVRSVNHHKRFLKQGLLLAALALFAVSIARPLFGTIEVQVEKAGVDVLLALDVSRSMLAEDAPSNRLASARSAIARLLERPSPDRYGLVIFAGESYLMAPLTQDHGAVERSVNAVSTTSVSKPGTDLGAAIRLGLRCYDESQRRGKALVLISDGEQLQGDAILAAREAAAKGVAIFTCTVGSSAGARVPDGQRGQLRFLKNEFGREVVSRVNEHLMRQLAAAGRGFNAPLGPSGDGLLAISDRGLRPLAHGTQVRPSKDPREYFQWPLALGLLLLLWELLINERNYHALDPVWNGFPGPLAGGGGAGPVQPIKGIPAPQPATLAAKST